METKVRAHYGLVGGELVSEAAEEEKQPSDEGEA